MSTPQQIQKSLRDILTTTEIESKTHLLKQNLTTIIENISQDDLSKFHPSTPIDSLITTLITQSLCIKNKDHKHARDLITSHLQKCLYGEERTFDFIISKIIWNLYISTKDDLLIGQSQTITINYFYNILSSNREMKNKECVSVLTNVILDILVAQKMFKECNMFFKNEVLGSDQLAVFNYYKGRVHLASEKYDAALEALQYSSILSSDEKFVGFIDKYIVVCYLLKSDLYSLKSFKWRKTHRHYFELYESIRSGDKKLFQNVLHRNRHVYLRDGVYLVLQRMYQNVIEEGIRKISLVYNKISMIDINNILGLEIEDVHFLLVKNIKNGVIKGLLDDGVFVSEKIEERVVDLGGRIKEAVRSFQTMGEMMRYPKSKPLNYENIDKNNIAFDFEN